MSKDIFYIINPIFFLGRIMGTVPFKINNREKNLYLTISKTYCIISTIIHVLVSVAIIWTTNRLFPQFTNSYSILIFLAYGATLLTGHLYYIADVFNKVVYRNEVIKIFTCLYQQDQKINKLGIKLPYNSLRNICLIHFIFYFVSMAYDVAFFWFGMLRNGSTMHIIYGYLLSYTSISQTISASLYLSTILIIRNMFRNLNTLFTRNFLRKHQIKVLHQLNDVEVLDELVQTYQNLTGALRRINSSVSSQILFLMGFYFSSLTLQVLSIVQHIIHFKSIIYIIWGICAVLIKEVVKLWILLTIADNCQQEVDNINLTT